MNRFFRIGIFFVIALFFAPQALYAQSPKTEKRIYLLDLTGSMEGRGGVQTPNILQIVKDNLASTIDNIDDPNTEIAIVPFTNKPHAQIEGTAAMKDSLITQIQKLGVRPGDTNIADAWTAGLNNLDDNKINYLFLLTDGLHNTGPSKQVLFDRLREWGETAPGNNEYAFYVMLTPNAKETEICEIIDSTAQMWLIESMDINASLIRTSMNQRKNVFSNPTTSISFFSNNRNTNFEDLGLQVSFEKNDFYYVDNLRKSVVGDVYTFDIIEKLPKIHMPLDTTLTLRLSYDKEKNPFVYLTPEEITFQVINQGPRILTVTVPNSKKGLKDLNLRKLKYKEPFQGYFRWTRKVYEPTFGLAFMSRPDTASTTTHFILNWNEEAIRAKASVKFSLTTSEGEYGDHIQVSNGDNDIAFVARTESDTLCLRTTVIPGIPSTRFSGDVVAFTNGIDTINDAELTIDEAVIGNWRLQYKKSWPFWIWLFWLLLTAAAVAVVIWLIRFCIKGVVGLRQVRVPQRPRSTATKTIAKSSRSIENSRPNSATNDGGEANNTFKQRQTHMLTSNEKKELRIRTGWSDDILDYIRSKEEAEIYIRAGLKESKIGGRPALVRSDINWSDYSIKRNTWLKNKLTDYEKWAKYNNADLIGEGFPPRDRSGDPYELHHIGQRQDSPFAELTWAEHMGDGNNAILHQMGKESEIDREYFETEKSAYWQSRFKAFSKEEIKRIYKQ